MKAKELIRAWKDPIYRSTLGAEDRARLAHPSGVVELSDDQLRRASGLASAIVTTFRTCTEYTYHRFQCCK